MEFKEIPIDDDKIEELKEYDISIHIFTVSSTMVGVCLTVIGILNIMSHSREFNVYTDDILSFNALLYLTSCFTSYASIRSKKKTLKKRLEELSDTIFLLSLTITCFACLYLVVEFSPGLKAFFNII